MTCCLQAAVLRGERQAVFDSHGTFGIVQGTLGIIIQ